MLAKLGLESPSLSLNAAEEFRTFETRPPGPAGTGEDYFGRSSTHSSSYTKPKMPSPGLPKTATVDRDRVARSPFLKGYLPQSLLDLLTPAGKARRGPPTVSSASAFTTSPYQSQSHFTRPYVGNKPGTAKPIDLDVGSADPTRNSHIERQVQAPKRFSAL